MTRKLSTEDVDKIVKIAKAMLLVISESRLMLKKPNKNTLYVEALSLQVMSATNLYVEISKKSKDRDFLVSAILLRALVEVTANIVYFAQHKNDQQLAQKFLQTAESTPAMLYALKNSEVVKTEFWTDTRITSRIKRLDEWSEEGTFYSSLYAYLSSYAHSDAGFISAYTHGHKDNLPDIFVGFGTICIMEIFKALEEAGALDKADTVKFPKILQRLIKPKAGSKTIPST